MRVLVTGGSGFLGKRLQKKYSDWIYLSSKDCDLLDYKETLKCLKKYNPDVILHLAARVGGIRANLSYPSEFFTENTIMNINVLKAACDLRIPRVLSCLSTCIFPETPEKFPMTEEDLLKGPPPKSNMTYGFAKRALHVHTMAIRQQYGLNYSTFAPSNIYGPEDNFDLENSHFVAALIRKVVDAERQGNKHVTLFGTGKALRQQLYVDDLVGLMPVLIKEHNSNVPLIIAPDENLSIKEACEIFMQKTNTKVKFVFDCNSKMDGQYRKDCANDKLRELCNFKFTKFEAGIELTYRWYKENL